jgi:hypothetical protein
MQRLAWVLSAPCLLSEEANRRLASLLPTTAPEPCGLHSYTGARQVYSFQVARPSNSLTSSRSSSSSATL